MAENTRKDPRARVLSMTVRYKSATLDEFIEHHSHDVSRGGMYIKTPQPFPPGTLLKFEVKIAADQKVMQGVGRVVWRREADDASADHPAGMGVKFIKLDEESKDIIDQLVTARTGDISAFDEVEPESESAQSRDSEPPVATAMKSASAEGFFPKSPDAVPQPDPEDRTVMKQATELLQEAIREVGNATGAETSNQTASDTDAIPKAPRVASVTPSPARTARLASQSASEQTPRVQRVPAAIIAAAEAKKTPAPASVEAESAKAKESRNEQQRFEPVKPPSVPTTFKRASSQTAPKTVPASPMAARKAAQNAPAQSAAAERDEYKLPIKSTIPPGRGMRIGIILLLVAGAAAAVMALSRKPTPPPEPTPSAAPSVAQKVESAPVVINLTGANPEAGAALGAAASASAAAAASAEAAASASAAASADTPLAVSALPKVETAPKVRQVVPRRKKADAGATVPTLETPDELYPTLPPASAGSSDSTPTTGAKSKSKSASPAAPAPTPAEDSPL